MNLQVNVMESLIGIHILSGCDTTSSFCGKGKKTALKALTTNPNIYLNKLGMSWDVDEEVVTQCRKFVLALYGSGMDTLNLAR